MTKKTKEAVKPVSITFPNGIVLKYSKNGSLVWHLPQALTTDEFRAFLSTYHENPKKAEKKAIEEAEKIQNFLQ